MSQPVESESTHLLKNSLKTKSTQKEVEQDDGTITMQEVDMDKTDLEIWKNEVKGCVSIKTQYNQNIHKVYSMVF